jgi:hypothetical protein
MNADFHRIVLEVFDDVIADYQFEVLLPAWWLIELANDKCILRLIYDSGFTEAQLVYPKEKAERHAIRRPDGFPSGYPMYPLFSVWKYLYPGDGENFRYNGNDVEGQAKAIKRLILDRLTDILKGDFSWLPGYQQSQKS